MPMETQTVYFDKPGRKNTAEVLRIARKRAEELEITTIVIASTTGAAAVAAMDVFSGMQVVAVSHSVGFTHGAPQPNLQKFTPKNRKLVEGQGGVILTTTHAFAGVSRALKNKFESYTGVDVIAHTLKLFGSGMKVACEVSMMAADAGLVRIDDKEIIAVAGSGGGSDTAIVLQPVISQDFFNLKVREILCKPR
ncbi:MAG: pyruvate kinase alpha/beta domain-containing protein [Desulfobacterales bacterium]|nr:pyruvate kinase alpha/beta domain-containing protein [Desulfobacterales bacterium]